jgi:DNA-binding GntR family transcriptional regulator
VSRQPISHALQLLKQQKLVEENGRRGLIVSGIDVWAHYGWPRRKPSAAA